MRAGLVCLSGLVLFACVANAQIIANGDIEQGGVKTAAGWSTDVREGDYEFAIAGGARSGERCLAIRCTGEPGWARWYTTDVFVLEGGKYRLSVWVKTDQGALATVWIAGKDTSLHLTAKDLPEWTLLQRDVTAGTTGRVGLYLQNQGAGRVHYDDVEVRLVEPPPSREAGEIPTDGAPLVAIVVPDEPAAHHGYLAVEAQRALREITGRSLAIVPASAAPEGRCLYIGVAPAGLDYGQDLARVTEEGIVLDVRPNALIWLGGSPRGEYYAVHEFLRLLGCRWIMPEGSGECLPRADRLTLPGQKVVRSPSFALRGGKTVQVYHYPPDMESRHVATEEWLDWAARNRMNALKASYPWTWDYGAIRGHQWSEWSGHTLYHALPPTEYFETHPEYYTLVKGKRTHRHTSGRANQVCVSNPGVAALIAEAAIEYLDGNPNAKRFGVCAEDEPCYWCECDACKALDTEPVDWSTNGEKVMPLTDRWMFLVNRVAEIVERKHPDRTIHTFAYASTRNPPTKHFPRRNVQIELTWWSRCFKHRMLDAECEVNREGMELYDAWAKLAPMAIYGYLDYHMMEAPCPYYHAEADFLRTIRARGCRHISDEWDTTFTSSPLLLNLRARLLWDINTNVDEFIDDFCRRAYGRAAPAVARYFHDLEQAVLNAPTEHVRFNNWEKFTPEVLAQANARLDRAWELAADDETVRARLARLRFSLKFAELVTLEKRLEGRPERFTQTEPLKAELHRLVQEYEIPVMLGAYNLFAASYKPPVEALGAERVAQLPEQWRFRTDPDDVGEREGWQKLEALGAEWKPISVHSAWEGQGYPGYEGYGWYAVEAELPAAGGKRTWLLFEGLDETGRLWINGDHVGDRTGEPGVIWDKPGAIEITGKFRPGEMNRIVLRAHDIGYAGGLYAPIWVVTK